MSNDSPAIPQVSKLFNAEDSDVTFKSSDNILFRVHRINLEINTAGLSPAGLETQGEIILLTEPSAILELLFQFIYPQHQPNLSILVFELLAPLAEAAEKYEVFPAITICSVYMKNILSKHIFTVLDYAIKHDYQEIVEEASHLLLGIPLREVVGKLPGYLVIPWVFYYESWSQILYEAVSFYKKCNVVQDNRSDSGTCKCGYNLDAIAFQIMTRMMDLKSLKTLDLTFRTDRDCTHLEEIIKDWRRSVEQGIEGIKPFFKYM